MISKKKVYKTSDQRKFNTESTIDLVDKTKQNKN